MSIRSFMALAAALFTVGCGGQTADEGPPAVDVSGVWGGDVVSSVSGTYALTLSLSQSGSNVTGTYENSSGVTGAVQGTVSGTNVSFTVTLASTNCFTRLIGGAEVLAQDEMLVSYNRASNCSGAESGDASLTRQE